MKKVTVKFLALIALIMLSPQALAQLSVVPCVHPSGYTGGPALNCATEATAAAQYQYLATGIDTSPTGLATSALGVNGGLINQLAMINLTLAKGNQGELHSMPNADLASRNREIDLEYRRKLMELSAPISADACSEVTLGGGLIAGASGGGGGPGGGGGGTPGGDDVTEEIKDDIEDRILTPRTENDYIVALVTDEGSKESCTQADVDNKVPNCAKVGTIPAANTDINVLMKKATPGKTLSRSNYSIGNKKTDLSQRAAMSYIQWNTPFAGPAVAPDAKQSPEARKFLIYQRRYNTRSLAVASGFISVLNPSIALGDSNAFVQQVWKSEDVARDYKEIYGRGQEMPATPSKREILNFMVNRQFTKDRASKDLKASGDELARRQLELQKLNAVLLLSLNDKADVTNLLLTHLLSNDIDPVNRAELVRRATQVSGSPTGAGE